MAKRPTLEPVAVPQDRGGTKYQHPAFGQIQASRVSGHTALFGSDFVHRDYVVIRINEAELYRDLGRDWHFGKNGIVEVALSEGQWATFVSSLNMGAGAPCTLTYRADGEGAVPHLPEPKPRVDQFKAEMAEQLQAIVARVEAAIAGSKTKTQATELQMILQDLKSNLPFVASQFDTHMENTVEAAKQEVHGYVQGVISAAGLTTLKGQTEDTITLSSPEPVQLAAAPEEDTDNG